MYSEKMYQLGNKKSAIREIFEYAKIRKEQIGNDNVFDFSIGNPSVPAPKVINDTLIDIIKNTDSVFLHGYTSAQGDKSARLAVANYIKKTFGSNANPDLIYFTTGAAAALSISIKAICTGNDEIILFAPYFPEYTVFTANANGKNVVVPPDINLMPDLDAFKNSINMHTKAVIINSPNNPSGVIYTEEIIKTISVILTEKSQEYGHPIFIIADEPYRELVFDDIFVPYIPNYYPYTIVCYSFSKVWSIPGERIGYIYVNPNMPCNKEIYTAICGAGRSLGYVCATSLFQFLVSCCIGTVADLTIYKENRDLLYESLTSYGFDCVHPDGAFYLFMKSPIATAEFCDIAKKYDILFVPANSFGTPEYVRIAYCVTKQQVLKSLHAFKKLAEECKILEA